MVQVVIAEPDTGRAELLGRIFTQAENITFEVSSHDLDSLVHQTRSGHWDVLLLSLAYPVEILRNMFYSIKKANPDSKVLLLSDGSDQGKILEILSLGASGHLEYGDIERFIVKAIQKIREGEAWIPRSMVTLILERLAWLSQIPEKYEKNCTKVQ